MTAPDSSSKNSDGSEKPKVGQIYSPTLTLMNFKNGSSSNSTPLKLLHCDNGYDRNKCTSINPNKTLSFDGTLGYTNKMLFGYAQGATSGTASTSIVGKLTNCTSNSCDFTAAQKQFINSVKTPALALIRKVQQFPGAIQGVAEQMAPIIANELALKYGEAALYAANQTFNGVKGIKPDFVDQNINKLVQELAAIRAEDANFQPRVVATEQWIKMILTSNPAIFVKPGL
ncbi:hypothetical protein ALQ08_200119 [Pseudomonas syringae pv. delphinii]|nr:hypothetical protein ALQ08_200119 [Pseudomonas syringae pv. delphinii]